MIRENEIIAIGQFKKPHGVKGEISAEVGFLADDLCRFSTLICCMDGIYVPFFVTGLRQKGYGTVLVSIDGVEDENAAKRFSNKEIYVLRSEYKEEEEVYCDYLVGFDIYDTVDGRIGRIVDVDDSTANVLFVVDCDGTDVYVPVADDLIMEIDESERKIVMDLPEGMVSFQLN